VENQYRETRKQRQGVDSNLRAGSIPVPPLLPPSPVLLYPFSLFSSDPPPLNPLTGFLSLSLSLSLSLFLQLSHILFVFSRHRLDSVHPQRPISVYPTIIFHTLISICEGGRSFLASSHAIVHRPSSAPDICPRFADRQRLDRDCHSIHRGTTPLELEGHCANFPHRREWVCGSGKRGCEGTLGNWVISGRRRWRKHCGIACTRRAALYLVAQTAHARAAIHHPPLIHHIRCPIRQR